MIKWEMFCDESYYDMWAVRPVGDKDFNSPRLFHVSTREDAIKLVGLLNSASERSKDLK